MQSQQSDRGLLDPSSQVVTSARWEDLDPLEFERFRRSVRERRGRSDESLLELADLELAKALGVVEANGSVRGVKLAALLLFGKEGALCRCVPTHEVAFQAMRALDVEVNDFFHWPLLRVTEEIEACIRARNRERELLVGLLRVGVPDYSERALREALANTLIHRDYQRLGAAHFQWRPDRIEISNPGGFPEGVRLDNLLVTAPRPRNPLLADAFKRAGIVERTARGIDTIYYEQLRNGRPAPSYSRSDGTGVVVVIPGGEANLDFVRLLVTEGQRGRALGLDELLILNALWQDRNLATGEAARLMQKPEPEARTALHRLLEAGLLKSAVRRKAARGTCLPPPTERSATRRPTSASAGSSRCNRSRWWCSSWRSMGASLAAKRQNCVAFPPIRPTVYWYAWRRKGDSPSAEPRRAPGMSVAVK
jgi:ATP-dependent DNA helicase RecG